MKKVVLTFVVVFFASVSFAQSEGGEAIGAIANCINEKEQNESAFVKEFTSGALRERTYRIKCVTELSREKRERREQREKFREKNESRQF